MTSTPLEPSFGTVPGYIRGQNTKLLHQGAEARIYSTTHNDQLCFVKERFQKRYRIAELDMRLRKRQMKSETRALEMCQKANIPAPAVLDVDLNNTVIYLSQIAGRTVRDYIESLGDLTSEENKPNVVQLGRMIGSTIAKLHSIGLIHGDLTTSNMIIDMDMVNTVVDNTNNVNGNENYGFYMIDFGLSQVSENVEERAVDLYVLERAIETTHANSTQLVTSALAVYAETLNTLTNKNTTTQQQQQQPQPSSPPPTETISDQQDTTSTTTTTTTTTTTEPQTELTDIQKARQKAQLDRTQRKLEAKNRKEGNQLQGVQVIQRLIEVRARGRKKSMIG